MKKSKLLANIFIGIIIYVVIYCLIYFLIVGLPFLSFNDSLKNKHTTVTVFAFLPLLAFVLIPFLSHFIYYKILKKYNTNYELSVTLKAVFIIFLIFTIIIAIILLLASGILGLIITIVPLLDSISYLSDSNRYDTLIHNEKIEKLWSGIKPEIADKIFQNDKEKISSIIISLSQILNINLKKCSVDQYKNILNIYGQVFTWKTEKNASDKSIILSLQEHHKYLISSETIAKNVLAFCINNISMNNLATESSENITLSTDNESLSSESKFCGICGNKLDDNHTLCNKCGNKVN